MSNARNPVETDAAAAGAIDEAPSRGGGTHVPAAEGLQSLMADRHHRIQVAAYYLAKHRGFAPGHELDDWLAAEDVIEAEDAARWSED